MKYLVAFIAIIVLSTNLLSNHFPETTSSKSNSIQLALLLDTSNSMDGLIDQAKSQLWKIVNELATSKKMEKPLSYMLHSMNMAKMLYLQKKDI